MSREDSVRRTLGKVVLYAILVTIVLGTIQWFFAQGIETIYVHIGFSGISVLREYAVHICIVVLLILGWMIINAIANIFCAIIEPKHGLTGAAAIKSMIKILGISTLSAGLLEE